MRICSPSVPRLKHEWNHTVGLIINLRCGTAVSDGERWLVVVRWKKARIATDLRRVAAGLPHSKSLQEVLRPTRPRRRSMRIRPVRNTFCTENSRASVPYANATSSNPVSVRAANVLELTLDV